MTELQELLESEQYEFLIQAVETIDATVKADEGHGCPDTRTFIKSGLFLLAHSKYFSLFDKVWNEQIFLNSESLELLEALGVEIEEFEESKFGKINDMDGNVLFTIGGFREYIFCMGELEKGTEYNWIVKCDGEDYEKYIQAGKQLNPTMLFDAEPEYEGWDKFFVADFKVNGDTERMINLRPLKTWMAKMQNRFEYFDLRF